MKERAYEILDKILDFLFPKDEIVIRLEEHAKENSLFYLPSAEETSYSFITSLWSYRDRDVRALVWAIKYRKNKTLAKYVGKVLYENILGELGDKILFENTSRALLLPIPVSRKKLLEKGFNQTEVIASAIKEFDTDNILIFNRDLLKKRKDTVPQAKLPRNKRLVNLEGAFSVENLGVAADKTIILIDDVTTTGSTLREAKKTLESVGAKKVLAFTIAH
ncbi:MAG: hypothetical protein A3E93_01150 [Candidatus Zambryskibacteria bacterium RIFCSPHIGHO2_12_FULL_43_12b]|uniref:Phosphoribosyltransferase domain-containing protein n=1 Tax=Candidatus Zambryskibacteria bacterium RIFCSPLOWO2_01_FULL_43_17 TaxID=1802760 RepID=A0A1G2U0N7_9BACT|nr:MAG: hypothetical protein A3E93_01150 [Candidatus Zambryskibacteria bacterium RIFCSPHIGHO2_12_FULL_43_12b]OHB03086.1 MAG: hypothetical protein A2920_00270 [Candidatus Zambryskibacteria bacterium RIFCSPLOWO2_01_FULL_43_17]